MKLSGKQIPLKMEGSGIFAGVFFVQCILPVYKAAVLKEVAFKLASFK